MGKEIVLIGGGGHAKVIVDIIKGTNEYEIVGICDEGANKIGNIPILGNDSLLPELYKEGVRNAFVCIGAIGRPQKRWNLYRTLKDIGYMLPVLRHESSIVARDVMIGEGTCIMPGVIINASAKVGVMSIINTASVIEHDCIIGENTHISPSVCLCGGVRIGKHTHIGARSVINQQLSIGNQVIIGSGSVVISNIGDGLKAYGVPARIQGATKEE